MTRRARRAAVTVALALPGALATPSAAAAVTVDTEAELRAAVANTGETSLTLSASIMLTNCAAGAGDLDRSSATALTVNGGDHTITQTCSQERVVQQSGSGKLTLVRKPGAILP